jgi:two-component system sensor histidine kinase CreC
MRHQNRNRIFVSILLLFCLSVGAMFYQVSADLDIRYRQAAEETLVDTAYLFAEWIQTDVAANKIDTVRVSQVFTGAYALKLQAKIYEVTKQKVDLRTYVTDANGVVIFDSTGKNVGKNFSRWHDVGRVLAGQYGARTTPDDPNNFDTAVMYVAAPIMADGKIIGVVSVGKATASQEALISTARQKLVSVALITLFAVLILLGILSVWLVRPSGMSGDIWRIIQQEGVNHPKRILSRVLSVLKAAFKDIRDALAGNSYTEQYITSLTHEIKSPLTAIKCAAELLNEPMPEQQRQRFTHNINTEVQRMQLMVDKLLELASIEKMRTLDNVSTIDLQRLVADAINGLMPVAAQRNVRLTSSIAQNTMLEGDAFLLHRALSNLIANAIDFSPVGSEIGIASQIESGVLKVTVRDQGAGIPEYALAQVFEKFYSLQRPSTANGDGKKSTGLGLAFVREIANLHGGNAFLSNHADGGAVATLVLPVKR